MPTAPVPSELGRFLAAPRPAVAATIGRDGAPVTAATWYEWIDGRFLLSMEKSGRRIGNIRNDPRVSLTVLADSWYSQVTLLGHAVEIRDDTDFADVDRLSLHYLGEPYDGHDVPCVTAVVEVARWYTYGDPLAPDR
jgi:PPOX class probable F420-dependent enzyme